MINQHLDQDDQTRITPALSAKTDDNKTESNSHALQIGTQLSEFEIAQVLGCGGFGIVYRAFDKSLNREVALKEYMPTAFARRTHGTTVSMLSEDHAETFAAGMRSFINEAKLLAQFNHDALVKVYRFWEANGTAYMVMPLYHGETLTATLRRMPAPPDEIWLRDFLSHLLSAITVLHDQQCFHRDIAPDNILIRQDECPVLLDFGAARHVLEGVQQSLTIILKPSYAPIEQYGNSPNLAQGPWTDLYALASVIHLAIMGKVPQPSMQRLLEDKQPRLAEAAEAIMPGRYSQNFLAAMDRALALKPKDRPQSVAEFQVLLNADPDQPSLEKTALIPEPTQLLSSRQAKYGISAAVVALLLVALTFILQKPTTPVMTSPAGASAFVDAAHNNKPPTENSSAVQVKTVNQGLDNRDGHLRQLKMLEEKQQAIAAEMDKLALLKKAQQANLKADTRQQQQRKATRENQHNVGISNRSTTEHSPMDRRLAELSKPEIASPTAHVSPPPANQVQAQNKVTEKSKSNEDLFVTPGF